MSSNWAERGTCWVAMLFTTFWMAARSVAVAVSVSSLGGVNTQTLGPNCAVAYAPHNEDVGGSGGGGGRASAVLAGTNDNPVAAMRAAAMNIDGNRSNRRTRVVSCISSFLLCLGNELVGRGAPKGGSNRRDPPTSGRFGR